MRRRDLLGLVAGAVGTSAGCAAPVQLPTGGGTDDDPIAEREFSLVDDGASPDADLTADGGAAVEYDREPPTVVVEGCLRSGYRSCYDTRLATAAYDPDRDSLTVVVLDDRDESVEHCPDVGTVVSYRVRIEFDQSLPGSVVVNHREDGGALVYEETFTRGDETTTTTG